MYISIMPTVNGLKRADLYHNENVTEDLPDEMVGEIMGNCLRRMTREGVEIGSDLVTLEVKVIGG